MFTRKKTYHETVDKQGVKTRAVTAILNSKYEKNISDIHPFIERAELESQLKMELFCVDTDDTTEEKPDMAIDSGFISTVNNQTFDRKINSMYVVLFFF